MYFLRVVSFASILALFLPSTGAVPHSKDNLKRQRSRPDDHTLNRQRADAVKEAFTYAWDGYYKYAFPNDELNPVTNSFSNSRWVNRSITAIDNWLASNRNGWGASAVDAFSTALVMQIPEIVNQILDFIPTINFDETSDQISLFETTIRYLGGLLSGR